MNSFIVTGLAFGDEGKGSWVDHLCRRHNIRTVVRFNGGAQALHHVTTDSGVTHGFSQFGSHSFLPGAKTLLSRFMLIEPLAMLAEATELERKGVRSPLKSLFISEQAPIIPYSNVLLNRIMESSRGKGRHGSCGLGIGLTQQGVEEFGPDALYAGDLVQSKLTDKLQFLYEQALQGARKWENESSAEFVSELRQFDLVRYEEMLRSFSKLVRIIPEAAFLSIIKREECVFEGAQGVLLDQYQGFFPHCTRSTTTTENAETLLVESGKVGDLTRYGLLRAYGTRHGAGPFVTEAPLRVESCDNGLGEWQGTFRHGWFDAVAARFALEFTKVDGVVITNLDRLDGFKKLSVGVGYHGVGNQFYDDKSHQLKLVGNYEDSAIRTSELFAAKPVYETVLGWDRESDSTHEAYLNLIEHLIGSPVLALSRRKDSLKNYR